MNRRDAIRRVAAVGATLALPAWAQSSRIILGQSAAFSGPAAQLGIQMNKGAKIYFDQLNAGGGLNGHSIELRSLDDGYEPDRCKANTEKLIKDEVFGLIGYVGTPTCMAALPLVKWSKRAGLVLLIAGDPGLVDCSAAGQNEVVVRRLNYTRFRADPAARTLQVDFIGTGGDVICGRRYSL